MSERNTAQILFVLPLLASMAIMKGCDSTATPKHRGEGPTTERANMTTDRASPEDAGPDLDEVKVALVEFLNSEDSRVQRLLELSEKHGWFIGGNERLEEGIWGLGRWVVRRHGKGFVATVTVDQLETPTKLGQVLYQVFLVTRDGRIVVSDWSEKLVNLDRIR